MNNSESNNCSNCDENENCAKHFVEYSHTPEVNTSDELVEEVAMQIGSKAMDMAMSAMLGDVAIGKFETYVRSILTSLIARVKEGVERPWKEEVPIVHEAIETAKKEGHYFGKKESGKDAVWEAIGNIGAKLLAKHSPQNVLDAYFDAANEVIEEYDLFVPLSQT